MSVFWRKLQNEWQRIFSDSAVLITIFGGVLFYAVLYPQPYLNDVPEKMAIAAIDLDNSRTSRQLLRWADATPEVRISASAASLPAARDLLTAGKVRGLLVIPHNFERDLRLSRSPVVAVAADANYFLVYGTAVEGLVAAIARTSAGAKVERLLLDGAPLPVATETWTPIKLNARPLFNTSMGYLGYVIPAVFILILQQTLLLASGLTGAGRPVADSTSGVASTVAARFLAMFVVYIPIAQFYIGTCFHIFDVTRVANLNDLWLMITTFVAAAAAAGVFLGVLIPKRELVAPLVMLTSLPLVFSAGFIWPHELIPDPVVSAAYLSPSTPAIQAFLQLNQMGASFAQVAHHWWTLAGLTVLFLVSSYFTLRYRHYRYVRLTSPGQPGSVSSTLEARSQTRA